MSGHESREPGSSAILPEGFDQIRAFNAVGDDAIPNEVRHDLPNGNSKPDGSVDSAVSLPARVSTEQPITDTGVRNGEDKPDIKAETSPTILHALPNGLPSIEDSLSTSPTQPMASSPPPRPTSSFDLSGGDQMFRKTILPPLPTAQPPAGKVTGATSSSTTCADERDITCEEPFACSGEGDTGKAKEELELCHACGEGSGEEDEGGKHWRRRKCGGGRVMMRVRSWPRCSSRRNEG